jgi:hypothetical protein
MKSAVAWSLPRLQELIDQAPENAYKSLCSSESCP